MNVLYVLMCHTQKTKKVEEEEIGKIYNTSFINGFSVLC